ncbi:tRNA nucleotidyltransferase (CCA-adding enzyme) [Desulfobaculum xiamenense]|uniref:tRNA nucleotidyltransferase (CCA-adding enzyme) n=1 Tax=Desulfobaculum xiamenense TaxID=995050 RepID=A0A846QK04_9BACT|nr:CBS domain-containing protein [Desulfobaculum xiamenense]NJB66812.1 tRNA nucleotidyltransferase (CCA-adding enzyme) [Desulfobaculum xiamenense]
MPNRLKAPTIITTHMNADFDALAAMIAASRLYPDATLVFPGSQEKNLRNFYIQSAMYMFNFRGVKEIDLSSVSRLVVVDTRQKSRVNHVAQVFENPNLVIDAYDHHPNSEDDVVHRDGIVVNWGSTATILCHELMKRGVTLDRDEANIIGLGIYEDTGSFTFNSTTPQDFAAASWLLSQGMDVTFIADLITRDLSSDQIALLNTMLESAKTHEIKGVSVVITEVSTEEYVNDFALLAHKMLDMEHIHVLFALARMNDRIQMVARSRIPDVDVGLICASFGGGGHAAAASASIKDRTPSQVKDELFALLYSHINPQQVVRQLMSHPPILIESDHTTAQASETMTRFGLKAAPVVDPKTGECKGILEHQIADKAVSHGLGSAPATDYLMRSNASVPPDSDLYNVMEIILGQGQRLVPVVEDGHVIGVLTRTDLINILIEEPARIPESLLPERMRERNVRIMLRDRLPRELFNILLRAGELARDVGMEAYAVGGFIRDILLNTPNSDLDLVVEGDGIAFARTLAQSMGGRVRAHHKFRTAVVILENGQRIDVATARLEYYEYPAALPTVELSSIKMDLYRRDFTINALAVQLNPANFGKLVDFFGAQRDIKNRVVRVLHSLSFVEDPTRILRAIRFAKRYNFRIGGQTDRLIRNAMQLDMIPKLSGSRIFHELNLIFEEEHAVDCLRQMRDYRLLEAIHPLLTLTPAQENLLEEIEKVRDWYRLLYLDEKPRNWMIYLLAVFNGMPEEDILSVCTRLNLTKRQSSDILTLRTQTNETVYRFKMWRHRGGPVSELFFMLEMLPLEGLLFFMSRYNQEEVRKSLSMYLTQLKGMELDVSGRDLKGMGLEPGPLYGEILRKLRAAMLDGQATCRDDQLALARRLAKDQRYIGLDAAPR